MKILTDKKAFDEAKCDDLIDLECLTCKKVFRKAKRLVNTFLRFIKEGKVFTGSFCCVKCAAKERDLSQKVNCKQCGRQFSKRKAQTIKSPNHFCGHPCSATYQNTHKTKGYRRSKLEKWIEIELFRIYPNLEFHFNRKDAVNSELDIYIPSLRLAFELNGIFHYEPIYGEEKLCQIQNNDNRKFQACLEKKIELCIIDTSSLTYFKSSKAEKYLHIIKNLIENKLNGRSVPN